MIVLDRPTFAPFEAFTCYNSPYAAHDDARAVDLYPGTERAPSPVAGEVIGIERVRAPPKPYAPPEDVLLLLDTGRGDRPVVDGRTGEATVARVLHVDPSVAVGDRVGVGDDLGRLLRSGYFAPWVDNHVHLGFRRRGVDLSRASGSIPLRLDLDVRGVRWDGTGVVDRVERTFVELSPPPQPAGNAGEWVGLAAADGRTLDGGMPHYDGGGVVERLRPDGGVDGSRREVRLLGSAIGELDGRRLDWGAIEVRANGVPLTGLSLSLRRGGPFRPKLIHPDHGLAVGDGVAVSIGRPTG